MKPSIYLAGPITGMSFNGATDWRAAFRARIPDEIAVFSPMRAKQYLAQETSIEQAYEEFPLSSARGITTRDRWDATRCSLLVANVLGADRISIGTVMEIAWADAARIPIVLVIEDGGNPHDHAMLTETVGFRVSTIHDAILVCLALVMP